MILTFRSDVRAGQCATMASTDSFVRALQFQTSRFVRAFRGDGLDGFHRDISAATDGKHRKEGAIRRNDFDRCVREEMTATHVESTRR